MRVYVRGGEEWLPGESHFPIHLHLINDLVEWHLDAMVEVDLELDYSRELIVNKPFSRTSNSCRIC